MSIQIVVKDQFGNWVPPPKPKVIYDFETDKFRYEDARLNAPGLHSLIGTGPPFWEMPWFLNLPIDEQVAFIKKEIETQIKNAKKGSLFDKLFSGFMSVFTKFIPYVGGLINKATQEGLKRELEKTVEDIKRYSAAGKEGILASNEKKRQAVLDRQARQFTQPQITTRTRSTRRR